MPYPYLGTPYDELGSGMMWFGGVSFLLGLGLLLRGEDPRPDPVPHPDEESHLARLAISAALVLGLGSVLIAAIQPPLPPPEPTLQDRILYFVEAAVPVSRPLVSYQTPGQGSIPSEQASWGVGLGVGGTVLLLMLLVSFIRTWPFHPRNPQREWDRPACVTGLAALTMVCGTLVAIAGYMLLLAGLLLGGYGSPRYATLPLAYGGALFGLGVLLVAAGRGISTSAERAWGLTVVTAGIIVPVVAIAMPVASVVAGAVLLACLLERRHVSEWTSGPRMPIPGTAADFAPPQR